ncbi:MAG: PEP-CTERM sorting domain-containing protein [Planctomycetes bacterium]|nr:PEP-CTERM sorting domain-containing protein [Planctomycetota bacterium]
MLRSCRLRALAAAAAVPEPTTCGLVLTATLFLAIGRRHSR